MSNSKIEGVLQGYVKFREGRKWKRRYCLLSFSPKTPDALHLYITKSYDEFTVYRNHGCMVDAPQRSAADDGSRLSDLAQPPYLPLCHGPRNSADECRRSAAATESAAVTASSAAAAQATSAGLTAANSLAASLGGPAPLDEVAGFESGLHLDKESHVIILIGCNAVHAISLSSLPEMFSWANAISKVVTDDHFRVTLSQTTDGSKLPQGIHASLHVQHWRICLIGEPPAGCKFICAWPLSSIAKAYTLPVPKPTTGGGPAVLSQSVNITSSGAGGGGGYDATTGTCLRNRTSRTSLLSSGRLNTAMPTMIGPLSGSPNTGSAGSGTANSNYVFHLEADASSGKGRGSHTFQLASNCHIEDLIAAIDRLKVLRHPQSIPANRPPPQSTISGSVLSTLSSNAMLGHYSTPGQARSLQPFNHWMDDPIKGISLRHGIHSGGDGSSCSPISSTSPSEDTGSLGCCANYVLASKQSQAFSCHHPLMPHCQTTAAGGLGSARSAAPVATGFLSDSDRDLNATACSPPGDSTSSLTTGYEVAVNLKDCDFSIGRQRISPTPDLRVQLKPTPCGGNSVPTCLPLCSLTSHLDLNATDTCHQLLEDGLLEPELAVDGDRSSALASHTLPSLSSSSYPPDNCDIKPVGAAATTSSGDRQVVGSVPHRRQISEYANCMTMMLANKASGYSPNDQRDWLASAGTISQKLDSLPTRPLATDYLTSNTELQWPHRTPCLPTASPSSLPRKYCRLAKVDEIGAAVECSTPSPASQPVRAHVSSANSGQQQVSRTAAAVVMNNGSEVFAVDDEDYSNATAVTSGALWQHSSKSPSSQGGDRQSQSTVADRSDLQCTPGQIASGHLCEMCNCLLVIPDSHEQLHRVRGTNLPPSQASVCGEANLADVRSLIASRRLASTSLQHRSCRCRLVRPSRRLLRTRSATQLMSQDTAYWLILPHRFSHRVSRSATSQLTASVQPTTGSLQSDQNGISPLDSGARPRLLIMAKNCPQHGLEVVAPPYSNLPDLSQLLSGKFSYSPISMKLGKELLQEGSHALLRVPDDVSRKSSVAVAASPGQRQLGTCDFVTCKPLLATSLSNLEPFIRYGEHPTPNDYSVSVAACLEDRLAIPHQRPLVFMVPPIDDSWSTKSASKIILSKRSICSEDERWNRWLQSLFSSSAVPRSTRESEPHCRIGFDALSAVDHQMKSTRYLQRTPVCVCDQTGTEDTKTTLPSMATTGFSTTSLESIISSLSVTETAAAAHAVKECPSVTRKASSHSDCVSNEIHRSQNVLYWSSASSKTDGNANRRFRSEQASVLSPPTYCNVASLLRYADTVPTSQTSQSRFCLPSSWSGPDDSHLSQPHLSGGGTTVAAAVCPLPLGYQRQSSADTAGGVSAYANLAVAAGFDKDTPTSTSSSTATMTTTNSNSLSLTRKQGVRFPPWRHQCTHQPGTTSVATATASTRSSSGSIEGGWSPATSGLISCRTGHSNTCQLSPAMTASLTASEGRSDQTTLKSQLMHPHHMLSVGELPEEVRDPSRNYAIVDLRPSPASSAVHTALLLNRRQLVEHRATGLDDIRWSDSSSIGPFSTKTSTGSDYTGSDGTTTLTSDTISVDAFPVTFANLTVSATETLQSAAAARPSSLSSVPRRRHSHSLSLTAENGLVGLDTATSGRSGVGGATMTLDRSLHHPPSQQLNYVHVFVANSNQPATTTAAVDPLSRQLGNQADSSSTSTTSAIATTIHASQTALGGVANSFGSMGSSGNGSRSMTSSATSSSGEGGVGGLIMGTEGSSTTADTGFTSSCSPPAPISLSADDSHVAYTQIDFARTLALGELSGDMEQQQLGPHVGGSSIGGFSRLSSSSATGIAAPLLSRWSVNKLAPSSSATLSSVGSRGSGKSVRKSLTRSIRSIRRGANTAANHRKKSGSLNG